MIGSRGWRHAVASGALRRLRQGRRGAERSEVQTVDQTPNGDGELRRRSQDEPKQPPPPKAAGTRQRVP